MYGEFCVVSRKVLKPGILFLAFLLMGTAALVSYYSQRRLQGGAGPHLRLQTGLQQLHSQACGLRVQFSEAVKNLGLYWLVLNELPPMEG